MSKLRYLAQRQGDLPTDRRWLTGAELDMLAGFRFAKRRDDWLLGRWTSKRALARCFGRGDDDVGTWQILPDEDHAPRVSRDGQPSEINISISHSGGTAFCAVAPDDGVIGCDLEQIASRDSAFVDTFLTARERRAVNAVSDAEQALLATLIWSAKESVLKAIHKGLSVDTWSVEVDAPSSLRRDGWQQLHARQVQSGRRFDGWWRQDGCFVWTLFAERGDGVPQSLGFGVDSGPATRLSGWR